MTCALQSSLVVVVLTTALTFTRGVALATFDGKPLAQNLLADLAKGARAVRFVDDGEFAKKNITAKVMMGVEQNADGDLKVFESTAVTNFILSVVMIAVICLLVKVYPFVYKRFQEIEQPEEEAPADSWERLMYYLTWMYKVGALTADQAIEQAGLDGYLLVEYQVLMRRILTYTVPVSVSVLCPMHLLYGMNTEDVDLLSRVGINNLPNGSRLFWVHVVFTWYVTLIVVLCVVGAQREFLNYRFKWLLGRPKPQCTTIMLENIPRTYCTDDKLLALFRGFYGKSEVESAYIVRRVGSLNHMLTALHGIKHRLAVSLLENKANATKIIAADKKANEQKIQVERERIQNAVNEQDYKVFSSSGFVTFKSRRTARTASREQYSFDSTEFMPDMAPEPSDVNYKNLALDYDQQMTLDRIGRLAIIGIFFAWFPVVVSISVMTSYHSLAQYFPYIDVVCIDYPALKPIIEGILGTLALKLFMAILPTLLLYIIQDFFAVKSGVKAQFELEMFVWAFDLIFVVLVTAIGHCLLSTLNLVIESPKIIFQILAFSLPVSSHFYLNYIVVGWFALSMEMVRISNLLKFIAFRSLGFSVAEAKKRSEPESQETYGMGTRQAKSVTYATIVFVYITSSPLMGILGWMLFRISTLAYTYLKCFVETRKSDSGGDFWVVALQQTLFAIFLYNLLMVSILFERAETFRPGIAASFSFLILLWGVVRFQSLKWQRLPYLRVSDFDREAEKLKIHSIGRYVQEEIEATPADKA